MATFFSSMLANDLATKAINGTETAFSFVREQLVSIAVTILTWQARARQRDQLSSMDDRLLQDMGLTRGDVAREISKRVWET